MMAGKTVSDRSSKALLKKALLKSDRFLQQLLLSSSPVQVFEVFCSGWINAFKGIADGENGIA